MNTSTQDANGRSLWNLPNALTWLRILMIPAILALFYLLPYPWADPAACAAFALAGITDSLDGYYARKLGQTSRLGAFLDPVADKLIVAAALVLIVSRGRRAQPHEGVGPGEIQAHHADRWAVNAAVPGEPAGLADIPARAGADGGG